MEILKENGYEEPRGRMGIKTKKQGKFATKFRELESRWIGGKRTGKAGKAESQDSNGESQEMTK